MTLSASGLVVIIILWQLASGTLVDAFILPSPLAVLRAAAELIEDGTLPADVAVSLFRIVVGWLIGSALSIPVGLLIGSSGMVKRAIDPIVHFFRFIPALALVTLFILWFGVEEQSKIALIAYAVSFIVLVNTATGVAAIPRDKLDAARILGANSRQLFLWVIAPAAAPYAFVGMRIAMTAAFVTIIGAEIIAGRAGLGYLVWTARLYFRVDWIFAGVVTIGVLGFVADRVWVALGRRLFGRYIARSGLY